jgi:type VI secretion system protein ImpF
MKEVGMKDESRFVARVLLFDRLIDAPVKVGPLVPAEPYRALDRAGLRASIRRELQRLIETRSIMSYGQLLLGDDSLRSVTDYGLPDFGWMRSESPTEQRRLTQAVARTIAVFEPRIERPQVTVERYLPAESRLRVNVTGVLRIGRTREPISFPLLLSMTPADEAANAR